jgi:ankyrin repeat protein
MTALHLAACYGHTETCILLMEEYAKSKGNRNGLVTVRDNNGWTALHAAAIYGRNGACALLLENGASINAKNRDGFTAFMFARESGFSQTAELLKYYPIRKMLDRKDADRGFLP